MEDRNEFNKRGSYRIIETIFGLIFSVLLLSIVQLETAYLRVGSTDQRLAGIAMSLLSDQYKNTL
jgi:hypothetical protein